VQFFSAPVLGVLSDRYGRRPVLLLSLVSLALDYVVLALAPTLAWLFVGRVLSAITSATWAVGFAYIADVAKPEQRAQAFGRAAAGFGLGFIIGPALGGVLGEYGARLPFWVAAGLTLANALYGFLVLPESLAPERRSPFSLRRANPIGALAFLRREPALIGLAFARFLRGIAHDVQPVIFVLYTTYRYGFSKTEVGFVLFAIGILGTAVSALLVQPLVRAIGERGTLLLGLTCGGIAFLGFGFAPSAWWFCAFIPFEALWWVDGAAMQALLTRRVSASAQGELQGALAAVQSIAGLIAPPLFAFTYAFFIEPARAQPIPGAAWYLAGALMLAGMVAAWLATRGPAPPPPASLRVEALEEARAR
jgi:DHA1 family tetracycline resistance protein-like MFS transporter